MYSKTEDGCLNCLNRTLCIVAHVIGMWATTILAQETILIRDIQPYIQNDSLKCRYRVPALFSGAVEQTLLSGLPVLIEEHYQYFNRDDQPLAAAIQKYSIRYDIWEDIFILEGANIQRTFPSIDSLTVWWNPRQDVFVTAAPQTASSVASYIRIDLRIILLGRSQSEQLKDWILNSQETEERLPTQDRNTGFTLNLNRLLSWFFRKDDISKEFLITGQSPIFDPAAIPRQ